MAGPQCSGGLAPERRSAAGAAAGADAADLDDPLIDREAVRVGMAVEQRVDAGIHRFIDRPAAGAQEVDADGLLVLQVF